MTQDAPRPRIDLDAQIEAEIKAAIGDMSFEDMLDYSDGRAKPRGEQRDMKVGMIVDIQGDDVLVEFGPKSQGICPISQFDAVPERGTRMDFVVDRYDRAEGMLVLSRKGAIQRAAWEDLEVGQVVEGRCTGTNKGGLEIEIAGHRAFMPAGQVDLHHVPDLTVFVGEKMPCEVLEVDASRGRVIVSRRAFLGAERARQRDELLETLEVGTILPGRVTSVQAYGAFVDIGGVDGLVHVSDLAWERVKKPEDVVKVGEEIQVKVLKIDRDAVPPRISLGLKQTMQDPIAAQAESLAVGDTVTGRVTRTTEFGAFVEIASGLEGLIHISELSHDRVRSVDAVVKPGEIVTVKILAIDMARRRVGLSLKAMREHAPDVPAADSPDLARMMEDLKSRFGGSLKGGLG